MKVGRSCPSRCKRPREVRGYFRTDGVQALQRLKGEFYKGRARDEFAELSGARRAGSLGAQTSP